MNLVIDDAVEVTLANAKKETPEERRNIGQSGKLELNSCCLLIHPRTNPAQRRQHLPHPAAPVSDNRRHGEFENC